VSKMEHDVGVILDLHGKSLTLQKITKSVDTEYGGIVEETVTSTTIIGFLEEINLIERLLVYGDMSTTTVRGFFKTSDGVDVGDRIVDGSMTYEVENIVRYTPYIEAELKKYSA